LNIPGFLKNGLILFLIDICDGFFDGFSDFFSDGFCEFKDPGYESNL